MPTTEIKIKSLKDMPDNSEAICKSSTILKHGKEVG